MHLQVLDLLNPELIFTLLIGGLDKSSPYIILIKSIHLRKVGLMNQTPTNKSSPY
jgi:hypothetical protein